MKDKSVLKTLIILLVAFSFTAVLSRWIATSTQKKDVVVIYTALDQIFSEPILNEFKEKTGITVKVAYDTEAAKTTGLVNRLIAEKNNPNADVFWNNEIARTIILKEKGVLSPYFSRQAEDIPAQFKDKDGYWTGFAARARILVYNKNLVKKENLPQSIFDMIDPVWKAKCAFANPLFGTTATHSAALFVYLGADKAKKFFNGLKENDVHIVPGNSTSRDRVVDGELPIGFTDTDDAWVAMSEGKQVGMIYPDQNGMGTLLIPNTVCLIKDAPHPEAAKKLIDFILSEEVEEKLAFSKSMQIPLRKNVNKPLHVPAYDSLTVMKVDFAKVAHALQESGQYLAELFLK